MTTWYSIILFDENTTVLIFVRLRLVVPGAHEVTRVARPSPTLAKRFAQNPGDQFRAQTSNQGRVQIPRVLLVLAQSGGNSHLS